MNYKKGAVLAALTLMFVLSLMLFGDQKAKAAGPICSVPGTYSTIQDAVNDPGCATINVAAGIYNESVTIARPVTISGPNAGVSALATRSPEATVTSLATTFNVNPSAGVIIDGFTINGDFGIYAAGSNTGAKFANNIITGTSRAFSFDGTGDDVSLLDNDLISNVRTLHVSAGPWTNMKINGNRFSGDGTIFFSGALSNSIAGFEFKNNEVLMYGNFASNISNGDISGNTFDAPAGSSLDIQISVHNSSITGNTFEGHNSNACLQIYGSQFGLVPSSNVTVSGNTFNQCGSAVAPWIFAIQLSPDITNISITGNDIIDSFEGVNTRDSTIWTVSPTIHVNFNNITGSTNLGVRNGQMGVLDATCNWWGAANGPGPVGPGSGDKVSTNVNYTPWLIAPGGSCSGPDADSDGITDSADNCPSVYNPGQQDTDGDNIGDACDTCPLDVANDADGDGVCGNVDNCPTVSNPGQQNFDGDSMGDACDPDDDNDSVPDAQDECPNTPLGTPVSVKGCPKAVTANQCKKDGWKTLQRANGTTFKNQGDCIQYVNTGK